MNGLIRVRTGRLLVALGAVALPALAQTAAPRGQQAPAARPAVNFSRQVRPLLSENCFACHGPDAKTRKARLRLDTREGAFARLRHGGHAIVPGKAVASELIARITSHDPAGQMPPPKSGKKLTAEQIDLLRRWIDEGAPWSEHWAFVPPRLPALPAVKDRAWARNEVDLFVLGRLEKEGLRPSPEADRRTLLRRVTFDLTGLPPAPADVDAFVNDPSADAYEKAVDRLLASPRYGEHMARLWLDAARYGDTHGMHLDNYREMWPYRDWVIRAYSGNLPYDRFLVRQLAGDLLPGPTLDDLVATGFNRCHVTTNEGGSIDEEVYVRNVVDRVDTTGVVVLGLSVGCARCHDHRYDPIRQKEYYQLFAFFNNLDGPAQDGNGPRPAPVVAVPTAGQAAALARLGQEAEAVRKQIAAAVAGVKYDDAADARLPEDRPPADHVWIGGALPGGVKPIVDGGVNKAWHFVGKPAAAPGGGKCVRLEGTGLVQNVLQDARPGLRVGRGDKLFAHVYLEPADPPKEIMLQWHTSGWLHRAYWGANVIPWGQDNSTERRPVGALPPAGRWVRLEVEAEKVGIRPGAVIQGWAFTQHGGVAYWDRAGLVTRIQQGEPAFASLAAWVAQQRALEGAGLPGPIQQLVKVDRAKRTEAQQKQLRDYFLEHAWSRTSPQLGALRGRLAAIEKERQQVEKEAPVTLVFRERQDVRPAYLLKRGEYDRRGEQVGRDTPAFLPPLPGDAPRNRLGLAEWLVSPAHPLTARVAVNRLWQQCFGTGLVKTSEDFGSQGEPPSHPELLDWLVVRFREDGWDVKRMMRRLVTSAAYRQSARLTKELLARDPANRLLARGPRFRLDAEGLRDQALAVSGLLVERVGGPSVKPPQPPGLWEAVAFTGSNTGIFKADSGAEKVHRRSLYTFWKRTAHPPQMGTLDAPSREACTVRRERTNTPLQALLLMNEQLFVEASRALAERVLREAPAGADARLRHLFRLATARPPDEVEMPILRSALQEHLARFRAEPEAARKLVRAGEVPPDPSRSAEELAAWTMLGNLVLNLDEVINR
jgi:mono/diheme cytochrome c family protein